jgi:anti-sigma factor RsiW
MTHLNELLSAYLDGELTADEQSTVLSHLADCAECRGELADIDAARTAMRSLPVLEAPAIAEEPAMTEVRSIEPARHSRARTWWAAAAAALVIVLGVGVVQSSADGGDEIDVPAAVEQHVARVSVDPGLRPMQVVSVVNQP